VYKTYDLKKGSIKVAMEEAIATLTYGLKTKTK